MDNISNVKPDPKSPIGKLSPIPPQLPPVAIPPVKPPVSGVPPIHLTPWEEVLVQEKPKPVIRQPEPVTLEPKKLEPLTTPIPEKTPWEKARQKLQLRGLNPAQIRDVNTTADSIILTAIDKESQQEIRQLATGLGIQVPCFSSQQSQCGISKLLKDLVKQY